MPDSPRMPSFREAVRFWLWLGCVSFGGPAGQIAVMHRELVERRRWISEGQFLHALNFCMLLPGPEAQQLATWLGWRLHGWRGGVAAGGLFVIPAVLILFALSWLYVAGGNLPWLAAIFHGLMAAVIAVVADAVLRIGRKALKTPALWGLALASFTAIYFFHVSFVLIILAAALTGWLGSQLVPGQFPAARPHGSVKDGDAPVLQLPPSPPATWRRTALVKAVCLSLWWLPILGFGMIMGWQSTPFRQGVFFSQAALITFGGAYAVLPYVAQQAVEQFHWLTHRDMMSGLALAETTPGPLIMVLQFVGFVGAWNAAPPESALLWGAAGALITTWATFLPCFLFVFLGAPWVEKLHSQPRLSAALMAITAAVVGVILNLGVKFSVSALWPQDGGGFDWMTAAAAVAAFLILQRWKASLLPVIGGCGLLGLIVWLVRG